MTQAAAGELVAGRSCDGCTMCCKLLEVAPLNKPRATWCTHCDKKRGCNSYADRPGACRSFHCGYLRLAVLDERWKPSKAKFLVNYEATTNRIAIHVDPARPSSWRVEPFYATIKQWSQRAFAERSLLIVWSAQHAIVVLPDRDVDLGLVRDDQFIVPVQRMTARGPIVDFDVANADDPRVKA